MELLEAIGRLQSVVEAQLAEIHDKIAELFDKLEHATEVMREQTEEMGALYDSVDEYRELLEWALRNRGDDGAPPFQLTSAPVHPAAKDFGERVSEQSPPTPREQGSPNESPGSPTKTGLLF